MGGQEEEGTNRPIEAQTLEFESHNFLSWAKDFQAQHGEDDFTFNAAIPVRSIITTPHLDHPPER